MTDLNRKISQLSARRRQLRTAIQHVPFQVSDTLDANAVINNLAIALRLAEGELAELREQRATRDELARVRSATRAAQVLARRRLATRGAYVRKVIR